MEQAHRLRFVKTLAMLPYIFTATGVTQGTNHITISIPLKTCPVIPIGEVKAIASVQLGSGVNSFALQFVDQVAPGTIAGSGTCTKSAGNWTCAADPAFACTQYPASICISQETGSAGPDMITMTPSSTAADDTPRFEIDFRLDSNHGSTGNTNSCSNKQQIAINYYTVTIVSAPASTFTGGCLESFDGRSATRTGAIPSGSDSCTAGSETLNPIPVPIVNAAASAMCPTSDPRDTVAALSIPLIPLPPPPMPQPTFACFLQRPSLDTMMVLDKSGSMATMDPGSTGTRIAALHAAGQGFLEDWLGLPPMSGDQVGVVTFDSAATSLTNSMFEDVNTTNIRGAGGLEAQINALNPGLATSIGAGLNMAQQNINSGTASRKTILLMSDGQQNTDPMVAVDSGVVMVYCNSPSNCTAPGVNLAGCTSAHHCPLFPSGSITPAIFVVSLGPSSQVDPAILQDLTNSTGGYYVNSESVSQLLTPFFLQMLQNLVHFNTYETVRLLSGTVSQEQAYSTTIPISSTSHNAVFSLMWPSQFGALRMTLTPPGGGLPIVKQDASGFINLMQTLPLSALYDPMDDWTITIEAIPQIKVAATSASTAAGIPFNLHMMTDDPAFKTDLSVVPGDYVPGGSIHLRASIRRFGIPVAGLGTHPGDRILFDLVKPGQSVGDMLSDSTASGTPPPGNPDLQPGADAKLFNTLQASPSALKHDQVQGIPLYDDGKPEHGDDVAGDGIYNALYPAVLPGHYNFLFWVESTDPSVARFSRQQVRTAYVRSVPDSANTVYQVSVSAGTRRKQQLSITMTPRVKPGAGCGLHDPHCGRMGPGWANYFWFTAPGHTPFKSMDNLDGTYTATLDFSGSIPPPVAVHFENVLAVIGDNTAPNELPQPLGPGNVVTANVITGHVISRARVAIFADGGGNLPIGTLGANYNKGASLDAGLEYMLATRVSLEGLFGYEHFPGKLNPNLNVYQNAVNAKVYLFTGKIQPFVNVGPGGYSFVSAGSSSTYAGGNAGGGVLFNLSQHLGIQASYNFNVVGTSGAISRFSAYQAGVRYAF